MKRRSTAGYTILEVMIVLAVTGTLFASVVGLLSGRQAATEFTQSVRDYEAKIQTVASDVATGYYQTGGFTCRPAGPSVSFSGGANNPGSNKGCLFVGKIITTGSTSADIFTLAGRQFKQIDNKTDVENISDAQPKAVTSPRDITVTYNNKFGIRIKNVYTISGNVSIGGFGFISELSGATGAGSPDTGSRGVLLYRLHGTVSPNANSRGANKALIDSTANLQQEANGIRICLWDGVNRRGEITVGENGSQTATNVFIDNGISLVCRNA